MNIAIDGPAGAGKSTVAQLTAKHLGYTYIDTGAMYRALTLAALHEGVSLSDEEELASLLDRISIGLQQQASGQRVFLNNRDVTEEIRHPDVSRQVSLVAKHPKVREKMMVLQRKLAGQESVVMDGRDIGTFVLPDAEVKVFLTASIEERAMRRYKEMLEKGHDANLADLQLEIQLRDKTDSDREVAPLRCAEDATILDSTGMTIEQVVSRIIELCKNKTQN
ncbi:(d)CMP kinase [Ammoniphilus resinae]|uniref:Cytidylate kinase n=1 Tax=Ammoniphilus resinae TaxID=861532 RepID=A0ABS4GT72_9BACL|nr:(d)CMP kinase [Ammoniphilus resinae]MBP1933478.1 cytidylate kinase [Ammoniphilus resinae]